MAVDSESLVYIEEVENTLPEIMSRFWKYLFIWREIRDYMENN